MTQQFGVASGTQTATLGTEHVLHSSATAGVYVLNVDTGDMLNNDTVELRIYSQVLSGDLRDHLAYGVSYANKQGDDALPAVAGSGGANGETLKISIPVPSAYHITMTLKQTGTSPRLFPWRVDML